MEPVLSFQFWLVAILFIIAAAAVSYLMYLKKTGTTDREDAYRDGLKYMAEGENRRAVEKLKEAVRTNSENIDAYIKLGAILREEGLYKNAVRIHKDLTLRANLTPEEETNVYRNLVMDYWEMGEIIKAESYLNQLKGNKQQQEWITPYLLKLYESREDWQKAIEAISKSPHAADDQGKAKMARLKVKRGLQESKTDEKAARILFKEAIKIDPACASGYLYLGDSYWRENRQNDAINCWTDMCQKVQDQAFRAFERLEKAWFEKGQFSKIEELYSSLLYNNEDNIQAIIALAEIYRKKGEHKEAMKLLQEAQKKDLEPEVVKSHMVKVLFDQNQYKEAAQLAIELLKKDIKLQYNPFKKEDDSTENELSHD